MTSYKDQQAYKDMDDVSKAFVDGLVDTHEFRTTDIDCLQRGIVKHLIRTTTCVLNGPYSDDERLSRLHLIGEAIEAFDDFQQRLVYLQSAVI